MAERAPSTHQPVLLVIISVNVSAMRAVTRRVCTWLSDDICRTVAQEIVDQNVLAHDEMPFVGSAWRDGSGNERLCSDPFYAARTIVRTIGV